MKVAPLLVIALLLAGCAAPGAVQRTSVGQAAGALERPLLKAMTFLAPVDTDRISHGQEPSVAVAPDGTIYVSAPSETMNSVAVGLESLGLADRQSVVFVSSDGGKTFVRAGNALTGQFSNESGGGDSDITVDEGGRVYMADLGVGIPVLASSDKGKSWDVVQNAAGGNTTDRQWIVGGRAGEAFLSYTNISPEGYQYLEVTNTTDGGKTWRMPATQVAQLGFPESYHGPIQLDRERRILYAPFSLRNGMAMAVSRDGGLTFDVQKVATGLTDRPGMLLPTAAIDRAGNIYEAWAEDGVLGWSIYYSWAPPGGGNWSAPHLATPGGDSVMPTMVAGADGRIAIAYYHSRNFGGEPDGPLASTAIWDLDVAHTLDAKASMPVFHADLAVARVHVGSICSIGAPCFADAAHFGRPDKLADRSLGDFFKAALAPDGKIVVAYDHDDPEPRAYGTAAVVVQDAGDSLV